MNEKKSARVVTLKDLWDIFVHRLWLMVLVAILFAGGMYLINYLTFVPAYSSTATLYILRQDNDTITNNYDSDFSLALKVVNDCDYLLKGHSVLDEVFGKLNLENSYEELSRSVSTSNPENTRILEVTVVADTPENAKRIVDTLCEIGQDKITEAMNFQQVNLYELGTLDPRPCNTTSIITYALVGIISALIVYVVFLIAFLLDDRIRTEEDIEKYLGLSVLGDIPNANDTKNRQYGYYSAYGSRSNKQSDSKRR